MWGICPRHDEVAIRAQFAAKGFPIKLCRGRSSWAAMLEVRRWWRGGWSRRWLLGWKGWMHWPWWRGNILSQPNMRLAPCPYQTPPFCAWLLHPLTEHLFFLRRMQALPPPCASLVHPPTLHFLRVICFPPCFLQIPPPTALWLHPSMEHLGRSFFSIWGRRLAINPIDAYSSRLLPFYWFCYRIHQRGICCVSRRLHYFAGNYHILQHYTSCVLFAFRHAFYRSLLQRRCYCIHQRNSLDGHSSLVAHRWPSLPRARDCKDSPFELQVWRLAYIIIYHYL